MSHKPASNLWTFTRNAFSVVHDNVSTILETLDNEVNEKLNVDSANEESDKQLAEEDYTNELDIYKQMLDESQMNQVNISNQSRLMIAEKEAELNYLRQLLQSNNIEFRTVDAPVDAAKADPSSRTSVYDISYEKLKAERDALEKSLFHVQSQLKTSFTDQTEIRILLQKVQLQQSKIKSLSHEVNELRQRNENLEKEKSEAVESLAEEYSKLASETEVRHRNDELQMSKLTLENEVLTTKVEALQHNINDFADRAANQQQSTSTRSSDSSNKLGLNDASPLGLNTSFAQHELKEARAKLINLQYDLRNKDEEISLLKEKMIELTTASTSHPPSIKSIIDVDSANTSTNSILLSTATSPRTPTTPNVATTSAAAGGSTGDRSVEKYRTEIEFLKKDVLRLQVEKEEAKNAGKLTMEQLRKIEQEYTDTKKAYKVLQESTKPTSALPLATKAVSDIPIEAEAVFSHQHKYDELELYNQTLENTIKQLNTQLSDLQTKISALQNSEQESKLIAAQHLEALEIEKHYRVEFENEKAQQMTTLQSDIEEKKRLLCVTSAELHDCKLKLNEDLHDITELKNETSRLQQAIKDVTNNTELSNNESTAIHMATICERDTTISELNVKLKELDILTENISSLEQQVAEKQMKIENLENQLKVDKESAVLRYETMVAQSRQERNSALEALTLELNEQSKQLLSKTVSDSELKLQEVKQILLEENNFALNELRSELTQSMKNQEISLKSEFEITLQSTVEKERCKAQSLLEEMLKSLQKDHETALQSQQRESELQLQSRLQVTITTAESDKAAALQSLRAEYDTKILLIQQTAQEEAEKAYVAASKLKADLSNLEKRIDAVVAEKVAEAELKLRDQHQRALDAVRNEAKSQIDKALAEREEFQQLYTKESKLRKTIHNKLLELQGNIRVVCRVRPILDVERRMGEDADVTEFPSNDEIIIQRDPITKSRFEYDRVFAPGSRQEEVFESVQPLCISVLDGFNVCIFAYGQTGSGKTYTMEGRSADPGVAPRAIAEVFKIIIDISSEWSYSVTFSMLEIYNESIFDLLVSDGTSGGSGSSTTGGNRDNKERDRDKLDIRQTSEGNIVPGLTEHTVTTAEQVQQLMALGQTNRAVGSHDMNERSSRSHSILTLVCRGRNKIDNSTTFGKLHLIDLAGSERVSKTDATGDRLKEAQNINRSLSALGDVINALGSKKASHVPYRNSKLTFLLQDSLGGNSKTLMFVTISPAIYNLGETVCSLNFASRCRNVELGQAKKQLGSATGGGGNSSGQLNDSFSDSGSVGNTTMSSGTTSNSTIRKPLSALKR